MPKFLAITSNNGQTGPLPALQETVVTGKIEAMGGCVYTSSDHGVFYEDNEGGRGAVLFGKQGIIATSTKEITHSPFKER